jgi:hypothetical protein
VINQKRLKFKGRIYSSKGIPVARHIRTNQARFCPLGKEDGEEPAERPGANEPTCPQRPIRSPRQRIHHCGHNTDDMEAGKRSLYLLHALVALWHHQ